MGIFTLWNRLSRKPPDALARTRKKLDRLISAKGPSLQAGGEAWTCYLQGLGSAVKCGCDAVTAVVLDFDSLFPPGPVPTDPRVVEALKILLANDPVHDRALEAAQRLALRHGDTVQIRHVEQRTCVNLANSGNSNGLVSKLLDRRRRGLLEKHETEEIIAAFLNGHRFEIASPWAAFFEELPQDQLPNVHQVHALVGQFRHAADIAEQQGDTRAALRYLLQCAGTEPARRAVALSEKVPDPELAINAHKHAAEAFYREGDYLTAAEHFQEANDTLRLSDCYLRTSRIPEAIKMRPEIPRAWLATVRETMDHMLREFVQRGASLEAIRLVRGIADSLRNKGNEEYFCTELARLEGILQSLVRTARASLTEESRNAGPGADVFRRWSAMEEAAGNFLEAGIQAEFAQDYVTATLMFEKAGAFGQALHALDRSTQSDQLERRAKLLEQGGDFFVAGLIYERLGQAEKAIEMFEQSGEFVRAANLLRSRLGSERAALDDHYLKLAANAGRLEDIAQLCWDFAGKASSPEERGQFLRRIKLLVEQGYVGAAWSQRVEGETAEIDAAERSEFLRRASEWADKATKDILSQYVQALGIDLGTSNTVVALYQKQLGRPEIVKLERGQLIPSIFVIDDAGQEVVGVPEAEWFGKSYKVVTKAKLAMGSGKSFKAGDHVYQPEEISARILQCAQQRASEYLRRKIGEQMAVLASSETSKGVPADWVTNHLRNHPPATMFAQAVVTVPAHFNEAQKQATRAAAEIAGINLLRLIHEPTAACLAQPQRKSQGETVLVADLGAGTFDLSVVQAGEGIYEVREIQGDARLGSSDLDKILFEHFHQAIKQSFGYELDKLGQRRLQAACEELKIELSQRNSWAIDLLALVDNRQPFHLELGREDLLELARPWLDRITATCRTVKSKPDRLLLVGGGTLMPGVRDCIRDVYQLDASSAVGPLEAVARGAAIQAAILTGAARNVLLLDVTPFSLGIKMQVRPNEYEFSKLIPCHTTIPTRHSEKYTTVSDNQTAVTIEIYQGESSDPNKNFKIGEFWLEGLPPAKAGIPEINVTFDIDANCLLTVTACDNGTGRECAISIADSHLLTPAQKAAMKERLQKNEQVEAVRRSLVRVVTSVTEMLENRDIAALPQLQIQLRERVTELEQHFSRYTPTTSDNEVILDLYQQRDGLSLESQLLLDRWPSLQQSARSWITDTSHLPLDTDARVEAAKEAIAIGESLSQRLENCIRTGSEFAKKLRHWISVLTNLPVSPSGEPEDLIEHFLQRSRYDEALAVFRRLSPPVKLRQAELGLELFARQHDREGYSSLLRDHAELLGVNWPDFERLNQCVRIYADSVALVQCETADGRSSGTGFAIGRREIATNRHVITVSDGHSAVPEVVSVITRGGRRAISAIRVPDAIRDDVAILRLADGEPDLRPLRLGFSDLVELGERIVTIGFPTPRDSDYKENLYCNIGLVNRITKSELCSERVMEVSIELHGGISGAPILNEFGEVIGLLTFSLQWERVAESGYKAIERSYYAIPVEVLRRLWRTA